MGGWVDSEGGRERVLGPEVQAVKPLRLLQGILFFSFRAFRLLRLIEPLLKMKSFRDAQQILQTLSQVSAAEDEVLSERQADQQQIRVCSIVWRYSGCPK